MNSSIIKSNRTGLEDNALFLNYQQTVTTPIDRQEWRAKHLTPKEEPLEET